MTFQEWLDEQEGWGFRQERIMEDILDLPPSKQWDVVKGWLEAAWQVGYEHGEKESW